MSRHNMKTKSGVELLYGYDDPLQEYYMLAFNAKGSLMANMDNRGEILEWLVANNITLPDEHINPMALDLPF